MQRTLYYRVRSVRLRPEYKAYARSHALPLNVMKKMAGAKRASEQRFDTFKEAKVHALNEDRSGADVEVFIHPVYGNARRLNNWRRQQT